MMNVGATGAINWLIAQAVGTAQAQPAKQEIVDENYRPELEGADRCNRFSTQQLLTTPEGHQHVAKDLLQKYFFGQLIYKDDNGKRVPTFVTDNIKYPVRLSPQEKLGILANNKQLEEVYTLLATANGSKQGLYFGMFDENGEANKFSYGSYLYTCGAQNKVDGKNPNADTVGYIHALFLKGATILNEIAGELPTRKVPVTRMENLLASFIKAKPVETASAKQPKIDSLSPAVIYAGRPQVVKISGSDLEGAEISAAANCSATISQTNVKTGKLVTFKIRSDAEELPQNCALLVKANGGSATGLLEIKEKPAARTVKAEPATSEPVAPPPPPPAKKPTCKGPAGEALQRAGLCE